MISKEGNLACANCGDDFTHTTQVGVYNPDREDSNRGLGVVIHGQKMSTSTDLRSAPSGRLQRIAIGYYCESCQHTGHLFLIQNEGQTVIVNVHVGEMSEDEKQRAGLPTQVGDQ